MSGKYQVYAEYKDSGVEWLGAIPSHWEIIQSRRLFSQRKERAYPDDEQLTASQKHGVIFQKEYMELESQRVVQVITGSEILKHVEPNDFVISMRSFQGGLEWCKYSGSVSSAYIGLISIKHVVPEFFAYLFKCKPYIQALQSTSNLVRDGQALRFENFSQVSLPKIPDIEQEKIAKFLDHETAKIDTLIDKQQQLIKLLKEKRQAMISHAVTKGLNPHAPMRDSGVEWLSEVPEHWDVCKLKHIISSLESGVSVNAADIPAYGDELGVLKTSCVYTRSFRVEENKTVLKEEENRVKCPIRKGAIIISRMNTPELVGASALVEADETNIYLPDRLWQTVFASNIKLNPKFIAFFMMIKGFRNKISLAAEGASSSMQNIAKDDYLSINIALPDIAEQDEIVSHLENKLGGFQKLEERANKAIELIQERRTALITAAVTGKIDVRNWQAPEPLHSNKETHKETVA